MEYSNSEMADMHFVYGMAHGNACEAQRIYEELYPRRRVVYPVHQLFKTFINVFLKQALLIKALFLWVDQPR